ncbi:hypothetical protein, partial [uncultured Eudoraea sp.]|uniref:hypothetical protein n=1 Tax=uncultured Eudoraea sp. TaxID=1035614 RepID=UPI00261ED78E
IPAGASFISRSRSLFLPFLGFFDSVIGRNHHHQCQDDKAGTNWPQEKDCWVSVGNDQRSPQVLLRHRPQNQGK